MNWIWSNLDSMEATLIIVFVISCIYGVSEIFMNIRQSRHKGKSGVSDKGSLTLIYSSIALSYSLAFAFKFLLLGRIHEGGTLIFLAGIICIQAGSFIRVRSIMTLKKYFSYSVSVHEDQQIIEKGMYRTIRHPGYLGQMFIFIGIGLAFLNWISLLCMIIPVFIAFGYRIRTEEQVMREHFGEQFLEYRRRTKLLIPGIF
jgi:protein-S-isoprenylcysteine O-methyltransferase Ste14